MTKYYFYLLIISILTSYCYAQSSNSNLDFTGMEEFWKIHSILSKNIEPDENDWERLFNTPGYSTLTRIEFSEDYFKKYFSLAYMPGLIDSLKKELDKSEWRINYLDHMTKVPLKKEEIENHMKELMESNLLTKESLELAKDYFPDDSFMSDDMPPISFVIFGNDARGYSPIIIDILYSMEQGQKLKYLLGHEAHHFYRKKKLNIEYPDNKHSDYNLVWVINQIHSEGVADQIDKRVRFFDGGDLVESKWAKKYKTFLNNTPTLIKKADSLLVQYSRQTGELKSISKELRRSVPMSGHPTGYFMANAIIEKLGKEELLRNVENPFEFFRLYNQVAKTNSEIYPVFSEEAINVINLLEERYRKI